MTAPAQNQLSGSLSVESTPPFSVLMSLYAREQPEYLRQCLASLAAQTLPPNEIVLVYDGGLPESLEAVVVSFSASLPLKIVRLPQNVGLGRALNAGLQACEHVSWCLWRHSQSLTCAAARLTSLNTRRPMPRTAAACPANTGKLPALPKAAIPSTT